jgi:putative DNA primase/helicase
MKSPDHSANSPTPQAATDPLPDTRPFTLAAAYLRARQYADVRTVADSTGKEYFQRPVPTRLRHWREEYYLFGGSAYERVHIEDLRTDVNEFLTEQTHFAGKDNHVSPLRVTRGTKGDVFDQLRDLCQARVDTMPAWLDQRQAPPPRDIIAFQNGLLDVPEWVRDPEIALIPPTPFWFSVNVLNCDYDPAAKCPLWIRVLHQCLDGRADLIALLQEWFGYCLTADNSLQKLLWMHGVSGAGKSTVCEILEQVVGPRNTVSFDLWDFAYQFGLAKFIGKRLAVARDAHLGHGTEADKVIAKLKQISGNDNTSVNRKNKDELESVKLLTRFVINTNEFPSLSDASDAIIRRAMFIPFDKSFVGREDSTLMQRLMFELPGITTWAIEGLARLRNRGKFEEAVSSVQVTEQFRREQSPVHAFVEDCCQQPGDEGTQGEREESFFVLKDVIYKSYTKWAKESGRATFSKDRFAAKLFRVVPGLKESRPWDNGKRIHKYHGIRIHQEDVEVP